MKEQIRLIEYIENLRKRGKYLFQKAEACETLGLTSTGFLNSVHRLSKKGKVAHLKKGLYQIVTEEYANGGSLPPEWFIDDLMHYLNVPYYVGLLTAASLQGSSHHAVQIFQVICSKVIPPLNIGLIRIKFYYSKNMESIPIQKIKVPSGYIRVSTPEGTAFDLLRYLHQSGHLNQVSTVLLELIPYINAEKLAEVASGVSMRYVQRMGYILDTLGFELLSKPLHEISTSQSPIYIPLRSDSSDMVIEKNAKWHILVNEIIETDI